MSDEQHMHIRCRLCAGEADKAFDAVVLGRHTVAYFRCSACDLLQTEEPFWLEQAYDDAISDADTGIVMRNIYLMKVVSVLLRLFRMQAGTYLDYGGGYGLFVRMMRDHGYDFRWYDPHAENLFVRGFELAPDTRVRGVTAFEVLEHLQDPRAFFDQVLGEMAPEILIASTDTYADPVDPDWHYFYFPTGQHIALYHPRTLQKVAGDYGYRCESIGNLHVFMAEGHRLPGLRWLVRLARFIYPCLRFDSLVARDHEQIVKRMGDGAGHADP